MGSSGHSHGGSYTPQPSWNEMTPEQKESRLQQEERAEQYDREARSRRRKTKAKKIIIGAIITVAVIGTLIGIIVLVVNSCANS